MKFLSLLSVAASVCAQFTFPDGPFPDFSHNEFLTQSVQLSSSAGESTSTVLKAASDSAIWMRVQFEEAELPADAHITVRSLLDGHAQFLDASSIRDWAFHSAFLNGAAVEVSIVSQSEATIAVSGLVVGEEPPQGYLGEVTQRTLCNSFDNRERDLTRSKDARFMLGGSFCSAWLIADAHGCFLSAGHCGPSATAVFQFNVPDSTAGGGTVNPAPEFQFPVDLSSNQGVNGGVGNDWRYVGANLNSNTGRSAREEMATRGYVLSTDPSTPAAGATWQLYGHGSATGVNNLCAKGSQGNFTARTGNRLQYRVSTTGGDSGSAVTFPGSGGDSDGLAVGIHTHGGCSAVGGANTGTWIQHADVQDALANPRGVCLTGYN